MSNAAAARLLFILFGLAAIVGGVYYATVAPVTCRDEVMQPGEICKAGGKHPSGPYDDMRTTQQVMGWIGVGIGSAVIGYVTVSMVKGSGGPAAPQHYPPPGTPAPGAGPHHPPQPPSRPYYPPQQYPPPGTYPPGAGPYGRPPPRR